MNKHTCWCVVSHCQYVVVFPLSASRQASQIAMPINSTRRLLIPLWPNMGLVLRIRSRQALPKCCNFPCRKDTHQTSKVYPALVWPCAWDRKTSTKLGICAQASLPPSFGCRKANSYPALGMPCIWDDVGSVVRLPHQGLQLLPHTMSSSLNLCHAACSGAILVFRQCSSMN